MQAQSAAVIDMASVNDEGPVSDSSNAEELEYMEQVLACWSMWAHEQSVKLGYPQSGNIWGLSKPRERRWQLNLTDDQLLLVDRAVVKLDWRTERKVIWLEYFSREPKRERCKYYGLDRDEYDDMVDELLARIYADLMPEIETWRPLGGSSLSVL